MSFVIWLLLNHHGVEALCVQFAPPTQSPLLHIEFEHVLHDTRYKSARALNAALQAKNTEESNAAEDLGQMVGVHKVGGYPKVVADVNE